MKTPSTSTPFKNSYTISISEHIRRVLGNRSLRSQMYFRTGIEAETKSEFWHGNIWQESPLFSPSSIRIDNAVAKASRLSFSFIFTNQTYTELDEALKIEHILLLKDFQEDTADISTNITSHDDKIKNIKTRKHLSKNEIQKLSLPVKFDDNLQFTYDIISTYDIYIEKRAALIHRCVEFYKQISYTLLNDDSTFDMHMNLHSGDIVQIQEETDLSYAILKGIFTHQNNNGLVYSFIWVDWLRESSILDPILQCPVYEKQTAENTWWHRVYLILY
ncbi:hypothetical protein C2G38_2045490 [Gigaspora rosea]|uniref:Uncharacterized protein n=1 Tax=Gigaspora rosea TaxID=44941 RepID=A0A397ULN7_9GLOM|nr:hypothetical protein C2G38_2045490 [Gigaspora rosea]